MLQVIKAEDVRDGEPRWWCPDDAYAARTLEWIVTGNLHTEWRREADAFTLAIVDRPAPTPTPAPGLDLDALEAHDRAMTAGPWRHGSVERHHVFCGEGDRSLLCPEAGRVLLRMNEHFPHDKDAAGIVATRNAMPHLIAEARAAVALRAEIVEQARKNREALRDLAAAQAEVERLRALDPERLASKLAVAEDERDAARAEVAALRAQVADLAGHWGGL